MIEQDEFPGDDYRPKQPSPRECVARELHGLLTSHGVACDEPERAEGNRCWRYRVRPVGADAAVEVFSAEYVRVSWAFSHGEPSSRVYATAIEACAFFYAAFVLGDMKLAMSIPVRVGKERKQAKGPEQGFPFDG